MAFSFRVGTNWCHDFPKLARDAGFYFNTHSARVRVDWNRISSIDIERLIRERDFQTIDENINSVIDYCLESEYDVKILDPTFVKLFRLAQLAVEYLLYCKQYLDRSVVILKDELKNKLGENVKMKEDFEKLKKKLKETEEKCKDGSKASDAKSNMHGEIHQCPHCPKTFVSASFANAHLMRRHSNLSNVMSNSSPVHEEYRNETEKLHNEIKSLKERLNQTERVIRSETSKMTAHDEISRREKTLDSWGDEDMPSNDHYKRYQEEISNLKSMLFTEIRNIKRKENDSNQQGNELINENIKQLISQQENEIQKLRDQLQDHLESNRDEFRIKLNSQEDYWKSKLEKLEEQHRRDIESLFEQLKTAQESSNRMKCEYEEKVSFLERQSIDQSKLLSAQSERLTNITRDLIVNQNKSSAESSIQKPSRHKNLVETSHREAVNEKHHQHFSKHQTAKQSEKTKTSTKSDSSLDRVSLIDKQDELPQQTSSHKVAKTPQKSNHHKTKPVPTLPQSKITKKKGKYSALEEVEKSDNSTETESITGTEVDSEELTTTQSISTDDVSYSEEDNTDEKQSKNELLSPVSKEMMKEDLKDEFESKLRDLGIDPEWSGIPEATYGQKIESILHHQNILSKRYPEYKRIRRKLLEELGKKVSTSRTSQKKLVPQKRSLFNKAVSNVKSKALKAITEFKMQKSTDSPSSIASSKNSPSKEPQQTRMFGFELLPKKPTQRDIQEIKKQSELELDQREIESDQTKRRDTPGSRSNLLSKDNILKLVEPPKPTSQPRNPHLTIEEFMRSIEPIPKLDMTSTKVTSTPSTNKNNLLQDSYSSLNDSDDQSLNREQLWSLTSTKNNKSVLKTSSGSMGSAVKKKVIFDLDRENTSGKESAMLAKPNSESLQNDSINEKKEFKSLDWNTSSMTPERNRLVVAERSESPEKIQFKTSQSEKIADLSRKIQEKLDVSRRKPAGSIEAMFSTSSFQPDGNHEEIVEEDFDSEESMNVGTKNSSSQMEAAVQKGTNQMPRPAPRKQLLFDCKPLD
ncbi:hypothetical protein QAD02_019918 [Eretmocerus hayati]|uniref:Uncharacterized protein n=1 Tax=Eretmocerus hayati TaxID=131215 RepID=A0ACC2PKY3_9HYME|nr:hypothetical protein QAD02_019918 [Eretmocerus hayati]